MTRSVRRWQFHLKKPAVALTVMVLTALIALVVNTVYGYLADRLDSSAPLTVQLTVADDCPGGTYVMPAGFDVNTVPDRDSFDSEWVYAHGGADAGHSVIHVTLQGRRDDAVVLHGLRVVDLERLPAPDASVVISKCYGGGDMQPRFFTVDLSDSEVRAIPHGGDADEPGDRGDPAIDFPYSISRSEPEVFQIVPLAGPCVCAWRLALDWTSGDSSGELIMGFGEGKFRTAPETAADRWYIMSPDGSIEAR